MLRWDGMGRYRELVAVRPLAGRAGAGCSGKLAVFGIVIVLLVTWLVIGPSIIKSQ